MAGASFVGPFHAARRIDSPPHCQHRSYVGETNSGDRADGEIALATDMVEALSSFAVHLRAELGRSENTVRAYIGDVTRLLL